MRSRIRVRIRIKVKSRIRIRIKVRKEIRNTTGRAQALITCRPYGNLTMEGDGATVLLMAMSVRF
jgi:hypothetical protein